MIQNLACTPLVNANLPQVTFPILPDSDQFLVHAHEASHSVEQALGNPTGSAPSPIHGVKTA